MRKLGDGGIFVLAMVSQHGQVRPRAVEEQAAIKTKDENEVTEAVEVLINVNILLYKSSGYIT